MDARSESTLTQGFASLARTIAGKNDKTIHGTDQELRNKAQRWLSFPNNDQWLLIFDNYDINLPQSSSEAPSDTKSTQATSDYDLKSSFPSDSRGAILITTRNGSVAERLGAQEHYLKKLDPEVEGLKVLLKRSKREQQSRGTGEFS